MRQDTAEVQAAGKLQTLWCFSLGAVQADVRNVERRIVGKYLGVPYRHHGRTLSGLDCWGLLKFVYGEMGFCLFDIEEYEKDWGLKGNDYFKENYFHDWELADKPAVFDAVLFKNSAGVADHAGIVLSGGRFMHTCRAGTVIGRLEDLLWKPRIEGFYRLKGKIW